MRARRGRGRPQKGSPRLTGGSAEALGGPSGFERSTCPGGSGAIRVRLAPVYEGAPWGFDIEARKALLLSALARSCAPGVAGAGEPPAGPRRALGVDR